MEIVTLSIKKDQNVEFEKAFVKASVYISSINGYVSHNLQKCIEVENQYVLIVNWEKIEDHTIGFRKSAVYQKWKELLHEFYDPFPEVYHYQTVFNQD